MSGVLIFGVVITGIIRNQITVVTLILPDYDGESVGRLWKTGADAMEVLAGPTEIVGTFRELFGTPDGFHNPSGEKDMLNAISK